MGWKRRCGRETNIRDTLPRHSCLLLAYSSASLPSSSLNPGNAMIRSGRDECLLSICCLRQLSHLASRMGHRLCGPGFCERRQPFRQSDPKACRNFKSSKCYTANVSQWPPLFMILANQKALEMIVPQKAAEHPQCSHQALLSNQIQYRMTTKQEFAFKLCFLSSFSNLMAH